MNCAFKEMAIESFWSAERYKHTGEALNEAYDRYRILEFKFLVMGTGIPSCTELQEMCILALLFPDFLKAMNINVS